MTERSRFLCDRPDDDPDLVAARRENNPRKEPTGHYTGRCKVCGSTDLWTDNGAYGCNKCRAFWCGWG